MRMRTFDYIFLTILILGGVNLGLIGLFDFNLIASLLGANSWISRLLYVLVGISALYSLVFYSYFERGKEYRY
ncbi:MAG: DUF378 domain-containing protein [Lachnospirales bacterium]